MVSQHAALRQSSTPPNKQLSEILVTDECVSDAGGRHLSVTCLSPVCAAVGFSWLSLTRVEHQVQFRLIPTICVPSEPGVVFCSVLFVTDVLWRHQTETRRPSGNNTTTTESQYVWFLYFCFIFSQIIQNYSWISCFEGDRETPVNSCMLGGVVFSVCSDIRGINICLTGSDACFLIIPLPRWCKKISEITRGEKQIPLHRFWICLTLKLFISADPTDHTVRFNRH